MEFKIIYEDENLLVIDKPAGIVVFLENETGDKALIDLLIEKFPYLKDVGYAPRYGIIHRLDKDTSGILLVAKNNETLKFLREQFRARAIEKKYLALVVGNLRDDKGLIETLIGRAPGDRRKQKIYLPQEPAAKGKRKAITKYKVLEKFKDYTLVEAQPLTGRKHQIRAHFVYLSHPITGDKLYGFKDQPKPKGLTRQFLHASYLKIQLPNGKIGEFYSELPKDLKQILEGL